jgi:hypothetical protein
MCFRDLSSLFSEIVGNLLQSSQRKIIDQRENASCSVLKTSSFDLCNMFEIIFVHLQAMAADVFVFLSMKAWRWLREMGKLKSVKAAKMFRKGTLKHRFLALSNFKPWGFISSPTHLHIPPSRRSPQPPQE